MLKYWIFTFAILLVIAVTPGNALDAEGKEFPDDTVFGRVTLFDNGNQHSHSGTGYHIVVLAYEGDMSRYSLGNGFFTGFQWYNDMYTEEGHEINLQLYRTSSWTSGQTSGDFTLEFETSWITAQKGLNVFYFKQTLAVLSTEVYFLAVLHPLNSVSPILFEACTSTGEYVMEAFVTSLPDIGSTVSTSQMSSPYSCISYSLQGLFLKTDLASPSYGACNLYIANDTDDEVSLVSQIPFPGTGLPSSMSRCDLIRVRSEGQTLHVTSHDFEFPDPGNLDCIYSNSFLLLTTQDSITDAGVDIDGYHCRQDGPGGEIDKNYLKLTTSVGNLYGSYYQGYKLGITAEDDYGWIIGIIVGCIFAVIIIVVIIVIVCVCCTAKKKTPGKVHSTANQTPQQPRTAGGATTYNIPSNRLPPIPTNSANKVAPPSGQNGSYGYRQNHVLQVGAGGAGTVAMQQGATAPPSYNSVVNANDQYGVPGPAIYNAPY